MKYILLLLLFGVSMCQLTAQTTVTDSLLFGGVQHHYRVYIPASRKCSMIIHLHGYASNATIEQTFTNYMPIADTAGFLVAYPDGLKDSTGNEYWNVGWSFLPNTDDVGYLNALIDTLCNKYLVDPTCVFVSGFSNGGFMAHKLACELGNKVAAIASVSGGMTTAEYTSCTPTNPVPVLEIHGTSDLTIPYTGASGSSNSEDIDSVMAKCVSLDVCNPIPTHDTLAHNSATTNGTTVDHYVWTGGTGGSTCELYKINSGGHVEWPGTGTGANNDFNASLEIWKFFSSYRTSNCTGLIVSNVQNNTVLGFYPNPCTNTVNVKCSGSFTLSVSDVTGKLLLQSQSKKMDVSSLRQGVYLIQITTNTGTYVQKLLKE
jgi:polyhydroxybutyrate depolymerase